MCELIKNSGIELRRVWSCEPFSVFESYCYQLESMGVITPAQNRGSCEKWIVIWVCSCQIHTVSRIFELFILEAESAVAVMGE